MLLGIPAVQFEMPPALRQQLVRDVELSRRFAQAIKEVYEELVVPWWRNRAAATWPRSLEIDSSAKVVEYPVADPISWCSQLVEELLQIESSKGEDQI